MPGRRYEAQSGYRYGFNGKEKDKDMNSLTAYDYGFRIYNPGIGKFLSVDPLMNDYPAWSPFPFAMNCPISGIDIDGLEYLRSDESRIEIIRGNVKIKIANLNSTTRSNFNKFNNDPKNWGTGIGVNTNIGSFSLIPKSKGEPINALDNTPGAPDPNFKAGESNIQNPTAKSTGMPDRRYKNRTVESASPAGSKGIAWVSIAIDVVIVGYDFIASHYAGDDKDKILLHANKAAMALYDVNTALQEGFIDKKYQTTEFLSDITNVVLSGSSYLNETGVVKDEEIINLGKKIYMEVSMRRYPYSGPVKNIQTSTGIIKFQEPNPKYDPNYGKEESKGTENTNTNSGSTGTGG